MHASEDLFERATDYDAMLHEGLRLTGEEKHYFIRGRLALLREWLPLGFRPARVLDYGCGTGETTAVLAQLFPHARVTGVDTATGALAVARSRNGVERVEFTSVNSLSDQHDFDLCYVNGVLHHIAPHDRDDVIGRIRRSLVEGGFFALFENNPWNLGTRWVMRRIPFDRDARMLSPNAARALLERNALTVGIAARHLFYFPRLLRTLRPLERYLQRLPLGGQYMVLGQRSLARETGL